MLLLLNLSDSYPLRCLSVCQSRKPPKCLIRQRSVFPLLALRRCLVTCYFTPVNVLVAHFFFGCRLSVMSHLCTSAWQTSASVANRDLTWSVLKYPQNIFIHFFVWFISWARKEICLHFHSCHWNISSLILSSVWDITSYKAEIFCRVSEWPPH